MSLRAHARHNLEFSRKALDMVLAEFKSDEDWFCQPTKNANHALWIVAHLGLADNRFLSSFRSELDHKPDGWDALFWFGSEINQDRSVYPRKEDVLGYFRDRRETLLKVLDEISDEELDAAPPEGERGPAAGAPSMGTIFLFAAFHEGIHMGQLTVCHRALGHGPVMRPQPAEAM